jgi:hypothetical protein
MFTRSVPAPHVRKWYRLRAPLIPPRWRETDSNFWFRAGGSARRAVWAREGRRLFSREGKRPGPPVIQSIKLQNELFLRDVAARETAIGGDRSAIEPKLLRSCQLRDGVPGRATFKPAQ